MSEWLSFPRSQVLVVPRTNGYECHWRSTLESAVLKDVLRGYAWWLASHEASYR